MFLAVHIDLVMCSHSFAGACIESYFSRRIGLSVLVLSFTNVAKGVDVGTRMARHRDGLGCSCRRRHFLDIAVTKPGVQGVRRHRSWHENSFSINHSQTMYGPGLDERD